MKAKSEDPNEPEFISARVNESAIDDPIAVTSPQRKGVLTVGDPFGQTPEKTDVSN